MKPSPSRRPDRLTLHIEAADRSWVADASAPIDLAIILDFDGPQPRFFAPGPARAAALRVGAFTGAVRSGASCNCAELSLAPHCHGTHTECVGHVTEDALQVSSLTPVPPALALLVTVEPRCQVDVAGGSRPAPAAGDLLITRNALREATEAWDADPWSALILRTRPNDPGKQAREYEGPAPAPYFSADAMRWIVERGIGSLVVDLPSLDRADDGGRLEAHRIYWGLEPSARWSREARRGDALVTELVYVPDEITDGLYLLDLQVAPFASDAAPSRPVIYALEEMTP
jgi:kynurenine formamidase